MTTRYKILTEANIEDSVTDGHTTIAPSGNAVFDALALKVAGPASSTDNAIARFDSTTGKIVQDSGLIVSDVVDKKAILGLNLLTTTDKTFTFEDNSGIFVTEDTTDRTITLHIGNFDNTNAKAFLISGLSGTAGRVMSQFRSSDGSCLFGSNCYPNGTNNSANRGDVNIAASMHSVDYLGQLRVNRVASGANPITWATENIFTFPTTDGTFALQGGTLNNAYAADAQASDTYVITLSPAPASYVTGMQVTFRANTANTGAATLNVNSLGAKTIVKSVSTALSNNDILANMFCLCIYDGTNFVLMNPRAL
jgi:hypothetical protein